MAVISINYDEPDIKTYAGVELMYNNLSEKFICSSGNFVKDWYHVIKFVIMSQLDESIIHSSSVNHFIMDGAPYDSLYLEVKNDVASLTKNPTGIEFFVEEETNPTWEELKKYCESA